jgi:hypothetical protein
VHARIRGSSHSADVVDRRARTASNFEPKHEPERQIDMDEPVETQNEHRQEVWEGFDENSLAAAVVALRYCGVVFSNCKSQSKCSGVRDSFKNDPH